MLARRQSTAGSDPIHGHSGADPPPTTDLVLEPWLEDPFPDYDIECVYLSSEALA